MFFLLVLDLSVAALSATTTFSFSYSSREAMLADNWNFVASVPMNPTGRVPRNTESTNGVPVSYDQAEHPGVLRIPVDLGDLWGSMNNSRNTLFRTLPLNWISARLALTFSPTQNTQQASLVLYQDDDSYLAITRGYNSGQVIAMSQEFSGHPTGIASVPFTATNFWLRLDRNLDTAIVTGYYSANGTDWTALGSSWQTFSPASLAIFVGGSPGGFPDADLNTLEVISNPNPPPPVLTAMRPSLVFNTVAGQARTNRQAVSLVVRNQDLPVQWSVSSPAAWITWSPPTGTTPDKCLIGVETSGLTPGIYTAPVQFTASAGTGAVCNVTVIVQPQNRAGVAPWRGARPAAMSMSTDDSYPSGIDQLLTNGLAGTFYMMTVFMPSWAPQFYNAGMELGVHTVGHPCITVNEADIRWEITHNMTAITSQSGQPANELITMAWPCGHNHVTYNVAAADYFLAVRDYNVNLLEDPTPEDFMSLKSFNSHEHTPFPPADLKTMVDAAIAQKKWFNLVLHAFTNDDGAISYAAGKDIWVAPVGSVIKYIVQRDRTIFTNYTETSQQIQFEYFRLPVEGSKLREFENAFLPADTITLQVDLTGLPGVTAMTVDGVPIPYAWRTDSGRDYVISDVNVGLTPRLVALQIGTNSAQPPVISNVEIQAGNAVITWTSEAERIYRLQYRDSLSNGAWQDCSPNIIATQATCSATNAFGLATQRFYRVRRL